MAAPQNRMYNVSIRDCQLKEGPPTAWSVRHGFGRAAMEASNAAMASSKAATEASKVGVAIEVVGPETVGQAGNGRQLE
jgi:sarcosine oxidase gamma subunit